MTRWMIIPQVSWKKLKFKFKKHYTKLFCFTLIKSINSCTKVFDGSCSWAAGNHHVVKSAGFRYYWSDELLIRRLKQLEFFCWYAKSGPGWQTCLPSSSFPYSFLYSTSSRYFLSTWIIDEWNSLNLLKDKLILIPILVSINAETSCVP